MEPLFCAIGGENSSITDAEIKQHLFEFLEMLGRKENILLIPPDFTRFHSQAGKITQMIHEYFTKTNVKNNHNYNVTVLPALGTHAPMTDSQIRTMFGDDLADMEPSPFVVHDWRNDVVTIGHAPAEMVSSDSSIDWRYKCFSQILSNILCEILR